MASQRVLFATTAGAGHFGPLVPFARACQRAGHDVLVAAPESFRSTVEAASLSFAPLGERSTVDAEAMFARVRVATFDEANLIVIRDGFGQLYPRAALPSFIRLADEWRPSVIVRETAELASRIVASARSIRSVRVAIGTLAVTDQIEDVASERLADLAAEHHLSIPTGTTRLLDVPTLTLTPPSIDDPGRGPTFRFREIASGVRPDPSLAGDEPLVYLTFGSEAAAQGLYPELYRAAIGAVAGEGRRVLVTVGRSADPAEIGPLPSGVRVEQWIDQDAVLPHAAVVVCHGGYGTVLGALRSGVPMVVMPLFAIDQRANGRRIAERGVGLTIGGPEDLDALTSMVPAVLGEARFRAESERVAGEIERLPTVDESVTVIVGDR